MLIKKENTEMINLEDNINQEIITKLETKTDNKVKPNKVNSNQKEDTIITEAIIKTTKINKNVKDQIIDQNNKILTINKNMILIHHFNKDKLKLEISKEIKKRNFKMMDLLLLEEVNHKISKKNGMIKKHIIIMQTEIIQDLNKKKLLKIDLYIH
jgi:hypothetical protein